MVCNEKDSSHLPLIVGLSAGGGLLLLLLVWLLVRCKSGGSHDYSSYFAPSLEEKRYSSLSWSASSTSSAKTLKPPNFAPPPPFANATTSSLPTNPFSLSTVPGILTAPAAPFQPPMARTGPDLLRKNESDLLPPSFGSSSTLQPMHRNDRSLSQRNQGSVLTESPYTNSSSAYTLGTRGTDSNPTDRSIPSSLDRYKRSPTSSENYPTSLPKHQMPPFPFGARVNTYETLSDRSHNKFDPPQIVLTRASSATSFPASRSANVTKSTSATSENSSVAGSSMASSLASRSTLSTGSRPSRKTSDTHYTPSQGSSFQDPSELRYAPSSLNFGTAAPSTLGATTLYPSDDRPFQKRRKGSKA